MTQTIHLKLPLLEAGQAQKHVTHNEALGVLDALAQLGVLDRDLTAPPSSPAEGARYIVAGSPTGGWAGHAGDVAVWLSGGWTFLHPEAGWLAFVADEGVPLYWAGSAWATLQSAITALQALALLGINTTADATNKLAVRSPAVLHTAVYAASGGSGDAQHKINKETAGDNASLLFQTNFSGRAEIGLTGDDALHVKVSSDGTTFYEAMNVIASGSTALIGIGTAAPAAPLHVDSANTPGTAGAATILVTGSANKERIELRSAGAAPGPTFQAKGFGGTPTSPAATQSGSRIFALAGGGHDGAAFVAPNPAIIAMEASETWSAGVNGCEIKFVVTPNGSPASAQVEALRVLNTGQIKLGSAASFSANGSVATALSALGPTGAHTSVQEWLAIRNPAGVVRYVPCF